MENNDLEVNVMLIKNEIKIDAFHKEYIKLTVNDKNIKREFNFRKGNLKQLKKLNDLLKKQVGNNITIWVRKQGFWTEIEMIRFINNNKKMFFPENELSDYFAEIERLENEYTALEIKEKLLMKNKEGRVG